MNSAYSIAQGDVLEVLAGFKDNSFDALACDPPYGFRFMGKKWDYDVPSTDTWRECLRVLKPGAPIVAFGGARTYHRLACGIEDAGAELRDALFWIYGKGYPKSVPLDRAISVDRCILPGRHFMSSLPKGAKLRPLDHICPDHPDGAPFKGYGTGLKPAHEPICLARKPLIGTLVENLDAFGVAGLAINACRIEGAPRVPGTKNADARNGSGVAYCGSDGAKQIAYRAKVESGEIDGRWPANLLFDEEAGFMLDAEVGERPSTPYRANEATGAVLPLNSRTAGGYSDTGGPSRFFYCSKVSTKEREAGCEGLALRSAGEVTDREDDSIGLDNPRAGAGRTSGARNHHPTLKPLSLTEWLTRLILPPTASPVLLVPFAGAGSEMIGAIKAGWAGVFGIEREEEYATIARARLAHWCPEVREAA